MPEAMLQRAFENHTNCGTNLNCSFKSRFCWNLGFRNMDFHGLIRSDKIRAGALPVGPYE